MNLKNFGVSADEAKNIKDYNPAFNLSAVPIGTTVRLTFTEDEPKIVQHKDLNGQDKESPVISVKDEMGLVYSLWLSGVSIRREVVKLAKLVDNARGGLEGVPFLLSAYTYTHETFGEKRGYRLQLDTSKMEINGPTALDD